MVRCSDGVGGKECNDFFRRESGIGKASKDISYGI